MAIYGAGRVAELTAAFLSRPAQRWLKRLTVAGRHFGEAWTVARVYIVSFRTHDDRRPSKFIVLADDMRAAINEAWEHGGGEFQSRFETKRI